MKLTLASGILLAVVIILSLMGNSNMIILAVPFGIISLIFMSELERPKKVNRMWITWAAYVTFLVVLVFLPGRSYELWGPWDEIFLVIFGGAYALILAIITAIFSHASRAEEKSQQKVLTITSVVVIIIELLLFFGVHYPIS